MMAATKEGMERRCNDEKKRRKVTEERFARDGRSAGSDCCANCENECDQKIACFVRSNFEFATATRHSFDG